MDAGLNDGLELLRRGEAVLVVKNDDVAEDGVVRTGHLVVAAERTSFDALARMLSCAAGQPLLTTTRDRLETLGIGALRHRTTTAEPDVLGGRLVDDRWLESSVPELAAQLATAATHFAGNDAEKARTALAGFDVRCTDWGGVVNCPRPLEAAVDLCRLAGLVPAALVCRYEPPGGAPPPWAIRIRDLVELRRSRAGENVRRHGPRVRMPTRHGDFHLQAFEEALTGKLHLALWIGPLREPTLTRIHSECLTGDGLGSLRCDCGDQLDRAMRRIAQEGDGVVLYMRQEGRGIGLINKLRTYALQDQGLDTVEANERIGFAADLRDYDIAAQILAELGVRSIRLLTNNPRKVRGLRKNGVRITDRVPLVVEPSSENRGYLDTKREKLGHWLP